MRSQLWLALLGLLACSSAVGADDQVLVSGELRTWHKVTLSFRGPASRESGMPNPFRDYRLDVTFRHGDREIVIPGYYAADGDASQSGAASGDVWQVRFRPDAEGEWTYDASFRAGPDVALREGEDVGEAVEPHGARGTFVIEPGDKVGRDFRARGPLRYVGSHYLQFAQTREFFLKGGTDSPENFLAYADFDGTWQMGKGGKGGEAPRSGLHDYAPHVEDWNDGDPTWRDGRGKGIIGALNYLASEGVNSVYFVTMNVGGDGRDVWPWIAPDDRDRFDCSKLDQWEIVFDHMDRLGIMLHVVTQEQENDQLLDGGELGPERRLYYRELVARFGHHPAITWNLGEENTNTTEQRKAFAAYIGKLDPHDHPVVVHTFPGKYDEAYGPLLGDEHLHGPSLQTNDTHAQTIRWIDRSREAGHAWVVCLDEIGPADTGVKPDADDSDRRSVREHLWGNLLAGGAGVEWYFGYKYPHNDLNLEDFRSRQQVWEQTRLALEFFHRELPFHEMRHADELTTGRRDFCFAKPGTVYAIYRPNGEAVEIDLGENEGEFEVRWFDPRRGGELRRGTVEAVSGPGKVKLGQPPEEPDEDWVLLVRHGN